MNLISVIVCTYNQEDTIRRALDAILLQECEWQFEIIIGEDGSKDNTREICEEYATRYPEIVRMMPKAPNKGILQNYFDCVRECKGKYIMECGGDDKWMTGRMQRCLDIMERHPEVGMVMSAIQPIDENSGLLSPLSPSPWTEGLHDGDALTYGFASFTHCAPGASAMTRTSMLREVMERFPRYFNGREFLMEDFQIAVSMGTVGKMYYIAEPTYYYYHSDNNISMGFDYHKKLRFDKNALSLLLSLIEDLHLDYSRLENAIQYRYGVILMHAFRIHDKKERDLILDDMKKHLITQSKSMRIIAIATSNDFLWSILLFVRSVYTKMKKLKFRMCG